MKKVWKYPDEITDFVVFRFVPDGTDKRELIKTDKKVVKCEE